ncbi:DNA-binding transcriptional regulator, partial [Streptomyces sp. MBT33]|uniref:helix-turn-helix domain-containing protein n=1 Tax=Streptomyces sp. MBT33 TaxID=1488363 RepID=UPI00190C0E81
MGDFEAIDALLARAGKAVPLPPAEERRALREELNLSRAQLAQALGVSPSTVGGWESGRDPSGEVREKYAYFLEGARTKLEAAAAAAAPAAESDPAREPEEDVSGDAGQGVAPDDDVDVLAVARPCVLCGQPAHHEVAGYPQHLDPAECAAAVTAAAPPPSRAERAPTTSDARPRPGGPSAGAGTS